MGAFFLYHFFEICIDFIFNTTTVAFIKHKFNASSLSYVPKELKKVTNEPIICPRREVVLFVG